MSRVFLRAAAAAAGAVVGAVTAALAVRLAIAAIDDWDPARRPAHVPLSPLTGRPLDGRRD